MVGRRAAKMSNLFAESERWGIEPGYHDVFGHWHTVPEDTIESLLQSLRRGGASPVQAGPEAAFSDRDQAYQGDGRRVWGVAVQLYALKSARNWGHGDFGDLKYL